MKINAINTNLQRNLQTNMQADIQKKLPQFRTNPMMLPGYANVYKDTISFSGKTLEHNKEYLKNPKELRQEISETRKRLNEKIQDIYARSVDYDETAKVPHDFFARLQNKMLYAVTGKTAAEIKHSRANANETNMGLTTWKEKELVDKDVRTAENYLKKDEMEKLGWLTVMYLAYAELQDQRRIQMTITDFEKKLDELLSLNEMEILTHKGKISKELADKKAIAEYKKFDKKRKQQFMEPDMFAKKIEEI